MKHVPKNLLWKIADKLSNQDLMTLCLTNKRYYDIICNNKQFWYWKIYKRFGDEFEIPYSLRQDCLNNPKCIWDKLTMVKPINIQPQQVKHFQRIIKILNHEYGYLDVSPFGAGKTHITFAIAATFKLNMIVVCPKSTINNWKKWGYIYGIKIINIITYQSLRGQECYNLNHNLLERVNGEYRGSEFFDKCVKSKLLLVFDEYQNLKNNNTQLASGHALVKSLVRLVRMGYKSRIALLSGTPCEEKDYVTSTFKMLGIILSDKLYNYNRSSKKYELIGIQEAINKCNSYDPDETFAIACREVNKGTAKTICYELYTRVLKRFIVSSMPPPPIDAKKDARNFYILMPDKDVNRLKNGILLFRSATNYKHDIQEVDLSGVNWGDVTTSRMEIDSSKIDSVVRLAIQNLTSDPNCKVLIYCNYKRDMKKTHSMLSKYNPLIMDGSSSEKQRKTIIDKFQADNNGNRVIISNPKVGGVGIDLDDKYGNRQRFMYILPSYFFTDQFQATGRIHRIGTKSKATIRFVYSRAFPHETGILNSMAKKSQVVRSMVTKDQIDIKFPGEYEELLELTPTEIELGKEKDMEITIYEAEQKEFKDKFNKRKEKYKGPHGQIQQRIDEIIIEKDIDKDKLKAYKRYMELIIIGMNEKEAVKHVCNEINKMILSRQNNDVHTVSKVYDTDKYCTEKNMIEFIEGFSV
uniref:DEAD/SNF2-like helicase n=1 Tax=Pithovirus LCPAC302 TaxID=2506593 RepID=A0A481Z6E5_9VIRU|nr:MAG: DEAD/SNF2-like helicase [Pithovirus LCPAC302]